MPGRGKVTVPLSVEERKILNMAASLASRHPRDHARYLILKGLRLDTGDAPPKIFSGNHSVDMWDEINNADTIEDLRQALYFVCCRIQELESKIDGGNLDYLKDVEVAE
jgi:hypothetical protein